MIGISDKTYLAFTVGPEIHTYANQVIERRIDALVEKGRKQCAEWVYDKSGFDTAMRPQARKGLERPFPSYTNKAHYEVQDLEYGYWGNGGIEVARDEVPEYFRPNETFNGAGNLIYVHYGQYWLIGNLVRKRTGCCSQYNQPPPVVLNESAHGVRF